jgi:hypothetical protein
VSKGLPMHDRLTGRVVPVGDGPILLGRFTVPRGRTGYRLGDRPLEPGAYLAGADRTCLLWHDGGTDRYTGDFGPQPLPPPILRDNVVSTAAKLADLRASPLSAWLAVPALVADTDKRLRPHPLEDSMRADMPYLRNVCREPHARLRTEHVVEPVSRARRITWHSVVHLSASSETWAARRLHGVEPARLLTPIQLPEYNVYENRVVATLVDRLWQHILARTTELNDIDRWVQRGREFLEAVQNRPSWRERLRLYDTLAPTLATEHIDQRIAELRQELDLLRQRLALLHKSPLYRAVSTPYTGSAQLRSTNLFRDNGNYRRCRALWDNWVRSYRGADVATINDGGTAHWCRSFADYSQLLVLRAMKQLGLDMDDDTPVSHPGETGPPYLHRGETVTVDREFDDTLVVHRAGRPSLRIVPLPHALTAAERDAIAQTVRHLTASQASLPAGSIAVLYPAQAHERARLPMPLRLAVSDVTGAEYASAALPALVPVGPSDIDSTGRVARLLRRALDTPALRDYPVPVSCPPELATQLALRTSWIEAGTKEIRVLRPARQSELANLRTLLEELCHISPRRYGATPPDPARIASDVASAVQRLERLTVCPVCGCAAERPDRALVPRRDGTYRCECECRSAWELRWCQTCGERYPVLIAAGLADELGGDGDYLDRVFSQDLLAPPCWISPRIYICPRCRRCPEAREDGTQVECGRCPNAESSSPDA